MVLNNDKKICISCDRELSINSFYNDRNDLLNEKFGLCKKCVKTFVDKGKINTLLLVLQTMNIPYLSEYWLKAMESNQEPVGNYLKNMNSLNQLVNKTFIDSDLNKKSLEIAEDISDDISITETERKSLAIKWGENYTDKDLLSLEVSFKNYLMDLENEEPSSAEESLIEDICRTELEIKEARIDGDQESKIKLIDTRGKLMDKAGISPEKVNKKGNTGLSTLGERIKKYEEEAPIIEKEEYIDSEMEECINTFFIGGLKQSMGIATEEDIEKLNSNVEDIISNI